MTDPHRQTHEGRDPTGDFDPDDLEPRPFPLPGRRRTLWVVGVLAALVLLAVLPPLINVNRFRRQIASSISRSLGRPVRIDSVTLDILPIPGFTLTNFVVGEDPAFGAEPVIRANTVKARLRWRSLWRRRVEFSRISLTDPSLNLVHRADGGWNVESILLQASRMPAAPTGQKGAGDQARFPYIEATGARVNVKMGMEKMPLSLTDADFALWLPQTDQWRLRLEAHPARTDTAATDTGIFHVEGTLRRAARLEDVPVDLHASWTAAPLGAASWIVMGRDAGLRGDLTVTAAVKGTVGDNRVETRLLAEHLRRADFLPVRTLDVDLSCTAHATSGFRRLDPVRCAWPADATGSGLVVTGAIADSLHPQPDQLQGTVRNLPASLGLDALRIASERVAPGLQLAGTLSADGNLQAGTLTIAQARLALGAGVPIVHQDVGALVSAGQLQLQPVAIDLGAPAPAVVTGHGDAQGYGLHLTGSAQRVRLLELAQALPQFGDGLEALLPDPSGVLQLDLTAERLWGGPLVWTAAPVARPAARKSGRRR